MPVNRLLADDAAFEPLPPPGPHEWLAVHEEHGQTFDDYVRSVKRPAPAERTICVRLVDEVPGLTDDCLSTLAAFAGAFFQLDVRILPPLGLDPSSLTTRVGPDTGAPQVYTGDILRRLHDEKPADAFCVVGITAHDLFPHPMVSFAFGEASATCRVGICSLARYRPPFCDDAPGLQRAAMRCRCCRVIAHEIGHMAGIQHCVYYRCVMNGSANLAESERRPRRMCPIDLRKLQWLIGFDLAQRNACLERFWRDLGDTDEAAWFTRRRQDPPVGWQRLAGLVSRRV